VLLPNFKSFNDVKIVHKVAITFEKKHTKNNINSEIGRGYSIKCIMKTYKVKLWHSINMFDTIKG
jgi:hypothetical protein